MAHVERLASGLQGLLCEGSFVDVRICCSDHSPSDGLGAHRVMLAAASPLLAPNLQSDEVEDEMICLHIPDYSSSCVASVLSILYYGETWLQCGDQVSAINSLLLHLGVNLEVCRDGFRIYLRKRILDTAIRDSNALRNKTIKSEPFEQLTHTTPKIKSEDNEKRTNFPLIQTTSLLKCPNQECNFCSLSIPEIQSHITECNSVNTVQTQTIEYVEVKPQTLNLKREQTFNVKQEAIDPLEKRLEPKSEKYDVNDIENEVLIGKNFLFDPKANSEPPLKSFIELSETDLKGENNFIDCEQENSHLSIKNIYSSGAHDHASHQKKCLKILKKSCPVCQLNFKTLHKLKEHVNKHGQSSGGYSRCHVDNCYKNIITARFFEHVICEHFGELYLIDCDDNDSKSKSNSELNEPKVVHSVENLVHCRQCDMIFEDNVRLLQHVKTSHSKDVSCVYSEFKNDSNSNAHLSLQMRENDAHKKYPCEQCTKICCTSQDLETHKSVHFNKTKNDLVCSFCGHANCKRFCKKSLHELVACPTCGKQILQKNLSSHLHYHKQSALRPFICQECSQTFTHASSLKRHALIHSGKQPYVCEQCNKGFFQKVAYQTHCKSHTSERLHCKGCNQRFLTQYLLNFHLKSKSMCRDKNL